MSGMIQGYDQRATSPITMARRISEEFGKSHNSNRLPEVWQPVSNNATSNTPTQSYNATPSSNLVGPHQHIQHNPFGLVYPGNNFNGLVQPFPNNYIRQRHLPPVMPSELGDGCEISYQRHSPQDYLQTHHSPAVKHEPQWNVPTDMPSSALVSPECVTTPKTAKERGGAHFGTEIDTLMKAIQAKSKDPEPQSAFEQKRPVVDGPLSAPSQSSDSYGSVREASDEPRILKVTAKASQDDTKPGKTGKKRYKCTINGCGKEFFQKTHLDIHVRSHTGQKPYLCAYPKCGRSFSQLGNLKTHERRHTGERPYECDLCGKKFAQRGNVRAHKNVHNRSKPYSCKLDDCGKKFTQLGNLKSHQNKFHSVTLRALTARFASIKDGDIVNSNDKELWEYFATLYKNSNKGIKGRGKDRKVGSASMHKVSPQHGLLMNGGSGYMSYGVGRGNMVVGAMNLHGLPVTKYEVFDTDDSSQNGSHMGSGGSPVGTLYDDTPSEGFEDRGRLAFGDRMY